MTCEKCQKPLEIGEWPFCPHGPPGAFAQVGDECDMWIENMGPKPLHFHSKAEHRRKMKELGLRHPERYVPHPAGKSMRDHAGTPDMRCMDEKSMRDARELMERAFRQKSAPGEPERPLARMDIHTMTPEEASRYVDSNH